MFLAERIYEILGLGARTVGKIRVIFLSLVRAGKRSILNRETMILEFLKENFTKDFNACLIIFWDHKLLRVFDLKFLNCLLVDRLFVALS